MSVGRNLHFKTDVFHHVSPWQSFARAYCSRLRLGAAALSFVGLSFGLFAGTAQAQSKDASLSSQSTTAPTNGFTLNVDNYSQDTGSFDTGLIGLSSSLQGAGIELPGETLGSTLFNLDTSDLRCLSADPDCRTRGEAMDLGYSKAIIKNAGRGLDFELTPSASLRFDNDSSSAIVGALVKIGDDLREDSDLDSNTWYVFAGADAEAVAYEPNSMARLTRGQFHLQDRIIVGDAQAGVGYRIGEADLSLGYFRREVASFGREIDAAGISYKEDAAALSFTWRR